MESRVEELDAVVIGRLVVHNGGARPV
jgi:hypothetical protein